MNCAVVGIGKLGLCFALSLEKRGATVYGVDLDENYISNLNSKKFTSLEPGLTEALAASSRFTATSDLEYAVNETDFIFILVQTPETTESYDHTILTTVIENIKKVAKSPKHIIVNSTVMPGFFRTQDVSPHTLSYSPAFVAQGTVMSDYENNGKFGVSVVGTHVQEVKTLMNDIFPNIRIMTPESTEVFKIADNTFRVMKIAYANFIGDLCKSTPGADVTEVAESLKSDLSIGSVCMNPGYGYGGPCYPRDLKALTTYAVNCGLDAAILEGIRDTNEDHHKFLLEELLAQNLEEYVFDSFVYRTGMKVLLTDNSPVLRLAKDLEARGKTVKSLQ